jgi:probable phosphoglycerate mutase
MIILVRHGETEGNAQRVMQRADIPLSAVGIAQAAQLAPRIAELGAARIVCSDLPRARMTAEPIVALTGVPIEYTPLLQERNFGDLRGTPYAALECDPFAPDYVPPGGESWPVFRARVAEAFALVLARRAELSGNLVVVTHGLLCSAVVQGHAQIAAGVIVPARFDNTSVTLLDPAPPHRVHLLNCAQHLAGAAPQHGAPA